MAVLDETVVGAVLTGGASRRMGRDKATLPVGGRPMGERVVEALRAAGAARVCCVGGAGLPGYELVGDEGAPGQGPMGGVRAALGWAGAVGADVVVVLACDLPDVAIEGIRSVVAALVGDPVALVAVPAGPEGRLEPLHAAWRPEALAHVDPGEQAVHRVIAGLPHVVVSGLDPAWLRNVNGPGDLDGP